ncbi:hypothetical protein AAZR23_02325 [Morganella sp. Je.2.23]|uniref:hypothetical protein n=1 Tax=Morganella sp. Je.2.23 TaxID=3142840 RepID=UPI003DA91927
MISYYKLGINSSNKKWEKSINIGYELFNNLGERVNLFQLSSIDGKINEVLFYKIIKDGFYTPITSIGTKFIAYDSSLENINILESNDVQLVPLFNSEKKIKYFLMNVLHNINCICWESSIFEPWPVDYKPDPWDNKKGRFFTEPVIYYNKIPHGIKAFRLKDWGGAFNIIISEEMKNDIFSLGFDTSFLDLKILKMI